METCDEPRRREEKGEMKIDGDSGIYDDVADGLIKVWDRSDDERISQ